MTAEAFRRLDNIEGERFLVQLAKFQFEWSSGSEALVYDHDGPFYMKGLLAVEAHWEWLSQDKQEYH